MYTQIVSLLKSLGCYSVSNPRVYADIARYAFQRRLAIPLDLVRWAMTLVPVKTAKDLTAVAQPPALGLGATANLMGTELRIDGNIHIDAIEATTEAFKVTFRVQELRASVLNNLGGNLAKLLASGALNLGKPASLLNFIGPKRPASILEAKDDRFVVDLLKIPSLAANPTFQKALAALTPVLAVGDIRTEGDFLLIGLRATPSGLRTSLAAFRS